MTLEGREPTLKDRERAGYRAPSSATRARLGSFRAAAARTIRRAISWEGAVSVALLLLGAYALVDAAAPVGALLWHEAHFPYNVDTPLYWTVGRGIVEGYVPYRDLFETKPPGIFLLSAFSFWLTGDYWLTNLGHIASLVVVALSPFVFLIRLLKEARSALLPRLPVWLALSSLILVLVAYTGTNAYEVQTETFGLAGTVIYMLLVGRSGRWSFLGRALGVMLAIGFKEPFLLLIPAVYLVLRTTPRRDLSDFWGPLAAAGLTGTVFLALMGWLGAFLDIYLRTMTSGHVKLGGSPIERALAFEITWGSLRGYSAFLPYVLLYVAFVYVTSGGRAQDGAGPKSAVQRVQVLFVGLLLSWLAVGMGGSFYAHHFVLAVPLYLALIFSLLGELHEGGDRSWFRPGIVGLVLLLPVSVPLEQQAASREAISQADQDARQVARALDAFLDRVHVDRYLWLGPGGYPPLPFTRHVPLGPLFFQQVAMFEGKYSKRLVAEFEKSLAQARVIVLFQHMTGPLTPKVKSVLARDFEPVPKGVLPPEFGYQVLVRKGLDLHLKTK